MSIEFTEFKGLNAIVTGAGSGIGLAVATRLKSAGSTVFGFDIAKGNMDGVATWVECDVGDSLSVKNAIGIVQSQVQVIDILANNAGVGAVGSILDATDEEWARIMNINVAGIARVSSAAHSLLRKSICPVIVNTCSIAATVGLPKRAVYSASKGAVMSLTLSMAADFVKEGIRVNCVNPGTADTPWVARLLSKG